MTLKSATKLVIVSLVIGLVISLARWVVFSFNLVSYSSNYVWILNGLGVMETLIHSIPMIMFFAVLNAKQKGI